MFTGIIEEVGVIERTEDTGGDLRIRVAARTVTADMNIGDSIAVSGCCLTVVQFDPAGFSVELSRETVAKTAPRWQQGSQVNLERAMAAGGRFGGHLVSGHVEGVGQVTGVEREPGAFVISVSAPEELAPYLVPKGSVTVDGVSLTVVDCGGAGGSDSTLAPWEFTLWLIPHTLEATTLGELEPGSRVNLEADLIAKYLERLQLAKEPANVT